jgi:hypothetical protein
MTSEELMIRYAAALIARGIDEERPRPAAVLMLDDTPPTPADTVH